LSLPNDDGKLAEQLPYMAATIMAAEAGMKLAHPVRRQGKSWNIFTPKFHKMGKKSWLCTAENYRGRVSAKATTKSAARTACYQKWKSY